MPSKAARETAQSKNLEIERAATPFVRNVWLAMLPTYILTRRAAQAIRGGRRQSGIQSCSLGSVEATR